MITKDFFLNNSKKSLKNNLTNKILSASNSFLNINSESKILLFNTEGDTHKKNFKKIIKN